MEALVQTLAERILFHTAARPPAWHPSRPWEGTQLPACDSQAIA